MKLNHNDRFGFEQLLEGKLEALCNCGIDTDLSDDCQRIIVTIFQIDEWGENNEHFRINKVPLSAQSMAYLVGWVYRDWESTGIDLEGRRDALDDLINDLTYWDKQEE